MPPKWYELCAQLTALTAARHVLLSHRSVLTDSRQSYIEDSILTLNNDIADIVTEMKDNQP
jgi:hypothetical protein